MGTVLSRKIVMIGGRNRKPRPKTFKSEEAAKKYAAELGIKDYKLEHLNASLKDKKIRVVPIIKK